MTATLIYFTPEASFNVEDWSSCLLFLASPPKFHPSPSSRSPAGAARSKNHHHLISISVSPYPSGSMAGALASNFKVRITSSSLGCSVTLCGRPRGRGRESTDNSQNVYVISGSNISKLDYMTHLTIKFSKVTLKISNTFYMTRKCLCWAVSTLYSATRVGLILYSYKAKPH